MDYHYNKMLSLQQINVLNTIIHLYNVFCLGYP